MSDAVYRQTAAFYRGGDFMCRTREFIGKSIIGIIVAVCILMVLTGCKRNAHVFTVGILNGNDSSILSLEGFKTGMAEFGYVEGKNIRYLYVSFPELGDDKIIGLKLDKLLAQDVDVILALGKISSQLRQRVKGGTPILFCGDSSPVEMGLVQSLKHPGGNITGVQVADNISKSFEWLVKVVNSAKKIYLPYEPDDEVSTRQLPGIIKFASQQGVELVLSKSDSVEETIKEIENLPGDIDAIFFVPSRNLNNRSRELSQAAIKRHIPTGAGIQLDEDILVTLTNDFFDIGKKTARLAHQIRLGEKPGDIPVETGEVLLTVNIKTAERIGLHIPDNILTQATTIIR